MVQCPQRKKLFKWFAIAVITILCKKLEEHQPFFLKSLCVCMCAVVCVWEESNVVIGRWICVLQYVFLKIFNEYLKTVLVLHHNFFRSIYFLSWVYESRAVIFSKDFSISCDISQIWPILTVYTDDVNKEKKYFQR